MNMKTLLYTAFFLLLSTGISAQGNLQFNQARIITNTQLTVPTDKVWKVTSVYGSEFNLNLCVDYNNDWLGLKCNSCFANNPNSGNNSVRLSVFTTEIVVNGVRVLNEVSGMPTSVISYPTTNCSGSTFCSASSYTCANKSVNPNLLPIWLPAGSTFRTGGPNTFASVLEFNVIP
jgi:hypothetical protein